MNITSLVGNHYSEMENRKKALRQKTADYAYRKNAQYFKPKFNPALEELVDLLTGKKEQDQDSEVQATIHGLKQNKDKEEQNQVEASAIAEDIDTTQEKGQVSTVQKEGISSQSNSYNTMMQGNVRHSAVPLEPNDQNVPDLSTATETVLQTQGQSTQTTASTKKVQTNKLNVNDFDVAADRVILAHKKARQILFKKAISRYSFHMQMAKQGFQFVQPTIYRVI